MFVSGCVASCIASPAASADTLAPPASTLTVTTLQPFAPRLSVSDGSDIPSLRTGQPVVRPLESQLQLLFEALFTNATLGTVRGIAAQVSYSYYFSSAYDLRATAPVLLQPFEAFSIPIDYSPGIACDAEDSAYVCQLAAAIRQWQQQALPSTRGGILIFDLSVDQSDTAQPFAEVKDLQLPLAYIDPAL